MSRTLIGRSFLIRLTNSRIVEKVYMDAVIPNFR